MGLSIRSYAAHKCFGPTSVRKAIASGRLTTEPDGTIDPDKADRAWVRNANPSKARGISTLKPPTPWGCSGSIAVMPCGPRLLKGHCGWLFEASFVDRQERLNSLRTAFAISVTYSLNIRAPSSADALCASFSAPERGSVGRFSNVSGNTS